MASCTIFSWSAAITVFYCPFPPDAIIMVEILLKKQNLKIDPYYELDLVIAHYFSKQMDENQFKIQWHSARDIQCFNFFPWNQKED